MKSLNNMIREEHKAPKEYKQLARHLHPKDRKIISRIVRQERKHYSKLKAIARGY